MNILLINHYAGSQIHGMEYRPYYLAKEWVKQGHNVTIIAASYSHLRSKQPTISTDFEAELIDGIHYIWLKTPAYNGNGLGRIKNMASFILKLFRFKSRILKEFLPDAVIASSTYPLDIYPAKFFSKQTQAKLIFEVHDLWPLSPMELGGMSPYHPFIMIMQAAENFAYKHCHSVVSLLPKAKEHMIQHGLVSNKFSYIPNGIVIEDWLQSSGKVRNEILDRIELVRNQNHTIVGYAGGHNISNALEYLLNAAKLLKNEKVSFMLVGKGTEKEKLKKIITKESLKNVYLFDPIPKTSIPDFLSKMDILYLGWNKSLLYRFGVSPNKLFDYMMAKKPVLHSVDAGNDIVAESGCGISVEPENPNAIAEGILILANKTAEERNKIGENGYNYILKNHDYKILSKKFLEVIEKS